MPLDGHSREKGNASIYEAQNRDDVQNTAAIRSCDTSPAISSVREVRHDGRQEALRDLRSVPVEYREALEFIMDPDGVPKPLTPLVDIMHHST